MPDAKPPRHVWVGVANSFGDVFHRYRLDPEPALETRWVVRSGERYSTGPGFNFGTTIHQKEAHRFETLASARFEARLWQARVYRLIQKAKP